MFNDTVQAALGFAVKQTSHIEQTVWKHAYPEITYPELVPVDTSAHEWAKSITYYSSNQRGKAARVHGRGRDIPFVGTDREQHETGVIMSAIGYDFSLEEINQARMVGVNLAADNAIAARRAYEEYVEDIAFVGDAQAGFTGLINAATPTVVSAADGASTDPEWSTKTADEILLDVNNALLGVYSASNTVEMADTVLLPVAQYGLITTKRIPDTTMTVYDYLMLKNTYTARTGKKLLIREMRQLAGAGGSSSDRMVVYKRTPEVLKMHVPMMLKFLPMQVEGLVFEVPGVFRIGGLDIRRPGAVRYVDDI